MYRIVFAAALFVLSAPGAYAYVGPGLGLGVIGALIGGILAVLLAVAGVVWYPVKRLLKKMKAAGPEADANTPDDQKTKNKDEIEQSNEA